MHQRLTIAALLFLLPIAAGAATPPPLPQTEADRKNFAETVCTEIDARAAAHGLPQSFIARLIWKESLFDPGAVSPKGAQGIAQFMPGTAERRGLDDPFDAKKALAASAAYLAELRTT
ncbi:lytic transglycosylase domain-containing protein, partial [Aestuariivirga sp.]|uniref:lytic transglycosylase domain-containing protein n=1 Tax=Aestuariivirga sp. TaxID=2650926 RepID=UPI003017F9EF